MVFLSSQGCGDTVGFIQAVLGLLLPLGYEYDPGLVLLSRMPGSGVGDCMWQQLIGLLKGFAKGHTLVLMQVRRLEQVWSRSLYKLYLFFLSLRRMMGHVWALLPPSSSGTLRLLCRSFWLRSQTTEMLWRGWERGCRLTGKCCKQQVNGLAANPSMLGNNPNLSKLQITWCILTKPYLYVCLKYLQAMERQLKAEAVLLLFIFVELMDDLTYLTLSS